MCSDAVLLLRLALAARRISHIPFRDLRRVESRPSHGGGIGSAKFGRRAFFKLPENRGEVFSVSKAAKFRDFRHGEIGFGQHPFRVPQSDSSNFIEWTAVQ